MNQDLQNALAAHGWDNLYSQHLTPATSPNARGEVRCYADFWHDNEHDDRPSFSFNIYNGCFKCFKTHRQGNYLDFLSVVRGHRNDYGEWELADKSQIERELLQEFGIRKTIAPEVMELYQRQLAEDLDGRVQSFLESGRKPWTLEALQDLGVGWLEDAGKGSGFVLPVYDALGVLINARVYRPNPLPGAAKFTWVVFGFSGNCLWPWTAQNDPVLILCEGETDALTLRSLGFAACSGTFGSGQPVPEGRWWERKRVYICFDVDEAGQKAVDYAVKRMVRGADQLYVIQLPEWSNRPDNADISDYVRALLAGGATREQVVDAVRTLMDSARLCEKPDGVLDADPLDIEFAEASRPELSGVRVRFRAQLIGVSNTTFKLPTTLRAFCPATGHRYCTNCPMRADYGGECYVRRHPSSRGTLELINVTDGVQREFVREHVHAVKQCPDFSIEVERYQNSRCILIGPPASADNANDLSARCDAFFLLSEDENFTPEVSGEYLLTGFCYAHPKDQHMVFLIDSYEEAETSVTRFQLTEEIREELQQFAPRTGQSVFDKLTDVANDLIDGVTGIRGRLDLHLAYRSVWFSALDFWCGNERVNRGWLECLVLGDTACGKSQAFQRLRDYFGFGTWIDCKNQSVAGILGAATQMPTGEWYILPGLLPQNDGRVVGFDEFSQKLDRSSLIESMASARSEGVVTISKAASARFRARVRSIWLANPGQGRLLSEIGGCGVELISRLIRQPEDIRRFDFALVVAQSDVPAELIQTTRGLDSTRYSQSAHRNLLLWIWSRNTGQIQFTPQAAAYVSEIAHWMVQVYTDRIPLVERNEQRKRVAKLAVSVAAQCFSCDDLGNVIVTPEHVRAAGLLFCAWYDKGAMGYDAYSRNFATDHAVLEPDALRSIFEVQLKPYGRRAAEQLLRLREFSDRTLTTVLPQPVMLAQTLMQQFVYHRLIQPVDGGRRNTYEVSPAGTLWLKAYVENP